MVCLYLGLGRGGLGPGTQAAVLLVGEYGNERRTWQEMPGNIKGVQSWDLSS